VTKKISGAEYRLDSLLADGAASYDRTVLTIEHVLPQTVNEGSDWAAQWPIANDRQVWMHRLANLVALNQRRNSKAQNYDFDRKKVYFGGRQRVSSYGLTTQVLNTPAWTPLIAAQRQRDMLAVLEDNSELV
jgi:hypothetical protein